MTPPKNLEPKLRDCLRNRGFDALTPVQTKVLDPNIAERDLRVTSQTGSGKTVAIGLFLKHSLQKPVATPIARGATVRALIVEPTRELAKQVQQELTWLYQPLGLRVACMTGGADFRDERRSLAVNPVVVVGTPGRLLDHIERGSLDMSQVESIVLDEADRMLDMGFTEAIEAIFKAAPSRKHTHLVSATLEPAVLRLANRYQKEPLHIEGTRYGEAHADIEHRVHLVDPRHRLNALVNLLLLSPDERTLVFARTRADVGNIADDLSAAGFRVGALSGDMEQPARDRALASFKLGKVTTLVATDVAARGIDVQDVTRVIQVDPPTDSETYTHRSGRTGRAGHKGTSIVLLAPAMQRRFRILLAQGRIPAKFLPLPSPDVVRAATDERTLSSLAESVNAAKSTERLRGLAERLLLERDPVAVVASLIARSTQREPEPRDVPVIFPESLEKRAPKPSLPQTRQRGWDPIAARSATSNDDAPRGLPRPHVPTTMPPTARAQRGFRSDDSAENWGMFRVTWGNLQGADARRLLAVICRRGGIRGTDVGAIRIGPTTSIVEVKENVAAEFASRALQPDPQEPRIRITPVPANGHDRPLQNSLSRDSRQSTGGKGSFIAKAPFQFPKKLKKFGRASA